MLIQGSCHCGNIRFTLEWAPDPSEIPARACGCSFCVKHGGVWTSKPDGALRVSFAHPEQVSTYAFGTRQARFRVCQACGAVPLVTSEIDGRLHAVVNVNTFDGVDAALLRRSASNFEGESDTDRVARWRRNWIADVRIDVATAAPHA